MGRPAPQQGPGAHRPRGNPREGKRNRILGSWAAVRRRCSWVMADASLGTYDPTAAPGERCHPGSCNCNCNCRSVRVHPKSSCTLIHTCVWVRAMFQQHCAVRCWFLTAVLLVWTETTGSDAQLVSKRSGQPEVARAVISSCRVTPRPWAVSTRFVLRSEPCCWGNMIYCAFTVEAFGLLELPSH